MEKIKKVRWRSGRPRDPLLCVPDNSSQSPIRCAQFCAHPLSKYIAVGSCHFGARRRVPPVRGPDNSTWLTALMAQNSLESVDEGLEHSASNVYTEYADPKRTEWITKIQPALKKPKLEVLVKACGKRLCRREIIELRAGRKKPHRRTQQLLESILKRLGFL
jgi:hypothetical protein